MTKKEIHRCKDCMENYSDDNCICSAEEINPKCYKHSILYRKSAD